MRHLHPSSFAYNVRASRAGRFRGNFRHAKAHLARARRLCRLMRIGFGGAEGNGRIDDR